MTEILYLQKRVSKTEDKGLYVAWRAKGKQYVVGPFACLRYAENWKARAARWARLVRPGRGADTRPQDTGLLAAEAQEDRSHSDSAELRS